MEVLFTERFRSYKVDFKRSSSNVKDIWYALEIENEMLNRNIQCKMHVNHLGLWKITGKRNPEWLLRLEESFVEMIEGNEREARTTLLSA